MHVSALSHHALLSSLLLLSACSTHAPTTPAPDEATRKMVETARSNADAMMADIAALAPACTIGTAQGMPGDWVNTAHAGAVNEPLIAYTFRLDAPVSASAFRVALNPKALHDIVDVQVRNGDGIWIQAWSGPAPAAPADCKYVKLEQAFTNGAQQADQMRIAFLPSQGTISAAQAALLQAH
jgi:hypothetical protein